ncbi:MAG: hypothetical protein K8R86_02200 [Bacteroidales bacterium]|nr:hypothetical protein [Bacteroidales bacterium]
MDQNHTKELLKQNWNLLLTSFESLSKSVEKCSSIGIKSEYSFEEMESIDSLTSKFARISDIYTQRIIRGVWALLREPYVPFIDLMNKAEKTEIIVSSESMLQIRDLRNQVAHEYLPEALKDLMQEVIKKYPYLKENINQTKYFLKQRNWL